MHNVPWPFWVLGAVLALLFVGGLAVEVLLTGTNLISLLEWGGTGLVLFGGGYWLLRWVSRKRRSFEERWVEDMTETGAGPSDA